ncbi:hypothetical protein [Flagellimonas flava]|uniref:hypothetical protein n=1 Tax=Flagellimonas flava TaxID=570519 RepID=UPI003D661AC2
MLPEEYNCIERFRNFVHGCFHNHPDLKNCEGAKEKHINVIKKLAGQYQLPSLYLGYLAHYGANDGPIELGEDCACSALAVIKYINKNRRGEWPLTTDNGVLISNHSLSFAGSLIYLDKRKEPYVAITEGDFISEIIADSFGTFLYRQVWLHRYFFGHKEQSSHLHGHRSISFDKIEHAVETIGFSTTFFSDDYRFTAEYGELKLFAWKNVDSLCVSIVASELWLSHLYADKLAKLLQMK